MTAVLVACSDNVILEEPIPEASEFVVEEPKPVGFEVAEPNMTIDEYKEHQEWHAAQEAEQEAQQTVDEPTPDVVHSVPWDAIARCESGYGGDPNWSINTGNGFYGGLQFEKESWDWAGGTKYAEYPHQASREQQIAVAEELLSIHPAGLGAWPSCTSKLGLR